MPNCPHINNRTLYLQQPRPHRGMTPAFDWCPDCGETTQRPTLKVPK